ncbi:MAG: APC family permease [Comamonadaceae bacterium]|jgi:amino acid transporter|nr:MAG: APC family permease [Comamonadaceae bacterium]
MNNESTLSNRTDSVNESFEATMTWRDALSLAVALPASALAVIGYWTGALGGWAAITLLAISSMIAILQNFLYAEMSSMFPDRSGGVAVYAFEAWKDIFRPIGALAAAGYWIGWSFGLAANALVIGELVQAQWFSSSGTLELGFLELGLGHLIAVATLAIVWLLNVFGIKPAVRVSYVVNALVIAVMVAVLAASLIQGKLNLSNLTWSLDSSDAPAFVVACVWLFLMGWTVYGTEIAATFTPEYRDPRHDVPKALTAAGLSSLAIFILMPLVAAGTVGEAEIASNPLGFNVVLFDALFGSAGSLAIVVLCLAMLNLMSVATADSGRALFGMARSGLTIRQLGILNRAHVPARAMTVGLVINIGLVLLIGNLLGVIFASNLGYMIAVVFALSGYVLLRRADITPDRKFRLPRIWNLIAIALTLVNLTFLLVAATHPALTGYGGWKEEIIGFSVLALALAMYWYRRAVQDRGVPSMQK